MQLSQQMLDTTERQSRKLKIAHQKYSKIKKIFICKNLYFNFIVESINQQSTSSENNSNEIDSDNEYDSEMNNHRSLSTKTSTTSLWKRKTTTTTNNPSTSTINLKRKCVTNSEHNNDQRERKKPTQRTPNSNTQNTNNGNNKKIRLNNESPSDEPTYCLCSQVNYLIIIVKNKIFHLILFFLAFLWFNDFM